MSAGSIAVKQGTDKSVKLHFFVTADDGTTADTDITGWTVTFTVKRNPNDALPTFPPKVITNHDDPTNGVTYVSLTHDDLEVPTRAYAYGIHVVDADGNEDDTGVGAFIVEATTEGE